MGCRSERILVAEYAFIELKPDRGSPHVADELNKALKTAEDEVRSSSTFVFRSTAKLADIHL
jgi:hypothetical protein